MEWEIVCEPELSPTAVSSSFARVQIAATMHIDDPWLRLVRRLDTVIGHRHPAVACVGERVLGQFFQVAGFDQVLKRLWRLLFVQRVLVDERAQGVEIIAQGRLLRVQDRFLVVRNCQREQNDNDADHHHQLNQSKAALSEAFSHSLSYHVLYFVPSSPVPSDLVYTSKTFCPPQESESGSSCTERRPHSSLPVTGSTGIRLRKRSFLPLESTPLTRVSRSGGYPWLSSLVWNAPRSAASL